MSKEKMIEEMMREQCAFYGKCSNCPVYPNDIDPELACRTGCNMLYNAGYRKQSKNTVELPCMVGDTVYRLKKRRGVWCILPREVVSITYRLDHLSRVEWEIFSTETDVLGKTVFLTEEKAEEALTKMKGAK